MVHRPARGDKEGTSPGGFGLGDYGFSDGAGWSSRAGPLEISPLYERGLFISARCMRGVSHALFLGLLFLYFGSQLGLPYRALLGW
jgi:hypothetical protein